LLIPASGIRHNITNQTAQSLPLWKPLALLPVAPQVQLPRNVRFQLRQSFQPSSPHHNCMFHKNVLLLITHRPFR
jgi:hypothetical protein